MSSLQVKGFGGLELSGNGQAIQSYPTRHVEELLGFLLLNQNRTYSRDNLIELLWPYEAQKNGRGRLSTVLWRLRGLFKSLDINANAILPATRDHITFAPMEPLHFDVESFEQELNIAWTAKDDEHKKDALTRATNLYQGDLFSGIYGDWCLIERERLAQKNLKALGELMHCHIRERDFAKAIEVGQTILTDDPLREEIHRDLISCFGRLGRRAEAAEQFQLCADYLMLELKVYPMPETLSIYQQVMTAPMDDGILLSNRDLFERANRARATFQQAGNNLVRILGEIESLNFDTNI